MQLEITKLNKTITEISLQPGTYTLGRGKHNDICLNDLSVSRNHAQLEISDDLQVKIVDLNSCNGTWLHNDKIFSKLWAPSNRILEIAEYQLLLHENITFKDKNI